MTTLTFDRTLRGAGMAQPQPGYHFQPAVGPMFSVATPDKFLRFAGGLTPENFDNARYGAVMEELGDTGEAQLTDRLRALLDGDDVSARAAAVMTLLLAEGEHRYAMSPERRALLAGTIQRPGVEWGAAYVIPRAYGVIRRMDSQCRVMGSPVGRLANIFLDAPHNLLDYVRGQDHYNLLRALLYAQSVPFVDREIPQNRRAFTEFPAAAARLHRDEPPRLLQLASDWDRYVFSRTTDEYDWSTVRSTLDGALNHYNYTLSGNAVAAFSNALRNIRHAGIRESLLQRLSEGHRQPAHRGAAIAYLTANYLHQSLAPELTPRDDQFFAEGEMELLNKLGWPSREWESREYPVFTDGQMGQLVNLLRQPHGEWASREVARELERVINSDEYRNTPVDRLLEPLAKLFLAAGKPEFLLQSCPADLQDFAREALAKEGYTVAEA